MKKFWANFWQVFRGYWEKGVTPFIIFIVSVLTLIYGYFVLVHEIHEGWKGHDSIEKALTDISVFVPVCSALVVVIIGIIDIIMSSTGSGQEKYNIEAATAEGITQGMSDAEEEALKKMSEWYRRKIEAEARDEPFTEKPPRVE